MRCAQQPGYAGGARSGICQGACVPLTRREEKWRLLTFCSIDKVFSTALPLSFTIPCPIYVLFSVPSGRFFTRCAGSSNQDEFVNSIWRQR